jgi:phage terminase large subunit
LEREVVNSIKSLEKSNPKAWRIYGLGEFVQNDKAVFQFNVIDWVPDDAEFVCVGMDFGYSNDPTAIVSLFRKDREIYLVENCYERGLVTNDIAAKLKNIIGDNRWEIWADSAEPRLNEELYRLGFNVKGVRKGKDSIKLGIDLMMQYRLVVTKRSKNIVKEFGEYVWMVDKNGNFENIPVDYSNHAIDAIRYVCMERLNAKKINAGRYQISIR